MRKYFLTVITMVFMLAFMAPVQSNAAIADGTYSINYQVNKPGSNSASMANDYFSKPAKLIVNNGKMTMQLTIKNSAWVTQFNPPGGAKVISANEGADQRVVQFSVANANLITIAMKIDIDDIDYHHAYSVDFVFDSSGLPEAKVEEPKQETQQPVKPAAPTEAPKTSSGSNTSSHTPATTEPKESTTESSKPVDSAEKAKDEVAKEEATKSEETVADTVQDEQAEVVENPETSDELPLLAALLFIVAAIVFVRTKQTKTNS
ncbi:MAG: heme uptake protein IsdC [Solibacillus sp.]